MTSQYNQAAGLSFGQNDDTDIASHAVVATCIDGIAEIPFPIASVCWT